MLVGQAGNEQAIADWHAANRAAVLACAVDDCDTFALTDDYDLLNFVSGVVAAMAAMPAQLR